MWSWNDEVVDKTDNDRDKDGYDKEDMRGYGILGDDKPDWVCNTLHGSSYTPNSELCLLYQPCELTRIQKSPNLECVMINFPISSYIDASSCFLFATAVLFPDNIKLSYFLSISLCPDYGLTPEIELTQDWLSPTPSKSLISHLSARIVEVYFLHCYNQEFTNELDLSSCHISLLINYLLINHLSVHFQFHLITAHKGHLQTCWIMVSRKIYKFTWSQSVRASSSVRNITVRVEWLRQSGSALSEPSERPRWQIPLRPASIPRIALHIALRLQFRRFFLRLWKRILRCSWPHLQLWMCIQNVTRFDY